LSKNIWINLALCAGICTAPVLANPKNGAAAGYALGDKLKPNPTQSVKSTQFRSIRWEDLAPPDWDPLAPLRELNLGLLKDSDPKAMEAMDKLMQLRNNAPLVPAMQGQLVRLSGFMVPVTKVKQDVTEFLLVPYFGACIHTPPPPSNMVLFITPDKPYKGGVAMETVTIAGTLKIDRTESPWGNAGYRISGAQVEKYVAPASSK
jgi:uncharacterized protein